MIMRKRFSVLCGIILTILCLVACGKDSEDDIPTIKVTSVILSSTEMSMTVGDVQTLTATVAPANATNKSVTWKSSSTSVATVSSTGEVKAVGAGTATITATADGKSATCKVTVKQESGGMDADIDPWGDGSEYEGSVN